MLNNPAVDLGLTVFLISLAGCFVFHCSQRLKVLAVWLGFVGFIHVLYIGLIDFGPAMQEFLFIVTLGSTLLASIIVSLFFSFRRRGEDCPDKIELPD